MFLASHAMRPLEGERWMKKEGGLVFQSLQQGPVPPLAGNPCTYIPGQGSGSCTLNGMNVAGSVLRAPPAFPDLVMEVGVASTGSNTHRQDQVS
ncbi:hypothetical protein Pint_01774 [Pistacia integerrima]|uniref:Uncharacterized protein n=1 Tax=Pistacia integerrima TaxID=434235 RepID=A0ACC0ZHN1_9ROSI|nr:hypothetical protein Pint_01774 [Pistacia integerrima]